MQALLTAALLVASGAVLGKARAVDTRSDAGFSVRMVKLAGDPNDPGTLAHVRFCREVGFNALWVYSGEAGVWTKERAPQGPILDPGFLKLAHWCRRHGMDLWVSINPVADSGERFVFAEQDGERRLLAFASMLRKKAGVRRIVLSFDDQPTVLRELSDVFRYGASTAPAHLDLARRVALGLPRDIALWMCASTYCDAHVGDGTGPYTKPFLAGLPALPSGIGIVWTGPSVLCPTITSADLAATRLRLGGRQLLLYDNFPVSGDDESDAMALILGALRGRDPGIRDVVAAYLANPERPLAGSRLSLLTTAEFLRNPEGYDPEAAAARAIARLAGSNKEAITALETQQLEWGGFIDGRNYWPRDAMNPKVAAERLIDPAFIESFTWTVERYPGRITALAEVADTAFRDDLLRVMRRRLAIARAIPLVVEYLARVRAGRPDAAVSLSRIDDLRRSLGGDPDAKRILDLFLGAAEIPNSQALR
jgi:hypothetical protein